MTLNLYLQTVTFLQVMTKRLQYIWGMASDYNLILNLPDLNQ